MNLVWISDQTGKSGTLARRIKRIVGRALTSLKKTNTETSLTFVTDKKMQELNKRYRRLNQPTDVLAFPQNIKRKGKRELLGDIVIATPTARKQAREVGHSVEMEFSTLAIHGLLHLLGYDHRQSRDARRMFRKQEELLKRIGCYE